MQAALLLTNAEKTALFEKSWSKSLLLCVRVFMMYAGFIIIVASESLLEYLVGLSLSVFFLTQVYTLGHEAAHNSLFPSKQLNSFSSRFFLGIILHSHAAWVDGHNYRHHKYTNVLGMDPGWSPKSLSQYNELSFLNKLIYRFYRSPLGAGLYYTIEVWFKESLFAKEKKSMKNVFDFLICISVGAAHFLGLTYLNSVLETDRSLVNIALYNYAVPIFLAYFVIGYAVYLQHTGPNMRWFTKEEVTPFAERQIAASARVMHNAIVQPLFIDVNEHTIHHLYPTIPLYNLKKAQRLLEAKNPNRVTVVLSGFREFLRATKLCKLYDPVDHYWLDFSGKPTTASIQPRVTTATQHEQSTAAA